VALKARPLTAQGDWKEPWVGTHYYGGALKVRHNPSESKIENA